MESLHRKTNFPINRIQKNTDLQNLSPASITFCYAITDYQMFICHKSCRSFVFRIWKCVKYLSLSSTVVCLWHDNYSRLIPVKQHFWDREPEEHETSICSLFTVLSQIWANTSEMSDIHLHQCHRGKCGFAAHLSSLNYCLLVTL